MKYAHQNIICIDEEGRVIDEFRGVREVMKRLQLSYRIVKALCENRLVQYNGYRLRYSEEHEGEKVPMVDDEGWIPLFHPVSLLEVEGYFIHPSGYIKTPQSHVLQGERSGNFRYKRIGTQRFKVSDLWKVSRLKLGT